MKILTELKKLHESTTQRQWKFFDDEEDLHHITVQGGYEHGDLYPELLITTNEEFDVKMKKSDAKFIVESHKYLPRLIKALEVCMEQRNGWIGDSSAKPWIDEEENNKQLEQILEGENGKN